MPGCCPTLILGTVSSASCCLLVHPPSRAQVLELPNSCQHYYAVAVQKPARILAAHMQQQVPTAAVASSAPVGPIAAAEAHPAGALAETNSPAVEALADHTLAEA